MTINTNAFVLLLWIQALLFLIGCQKVVQTELFYTPLDAQTPNYLPWVYPHSQAQLSSDEFIKGQDTTKLDRPEQLCFKFAPENILEESDEGLNFTDYVTWIDLTINNHNIALSNYRLTDGLGTIGGEYLRNPNTGEWKTIRVENDIGPYTICFWDISEYVIKGQNIVTFSLTHPKGKTYAYSWSFTISE